MSLLDDVSIMVTPNGVKSNVLFGVLPTPTEGSELVTNGNFATDSDWTKGTGWTISGGSANFDSSGQSDNANISQSLGVDISGIVNVDFTQGDNTHYWNNGSTNFKLTFTFTKTSGTDRIRVVTSGTNLFFRALNGDNLTGTIDDVSVKVVNDKQNATTVFFGDEMITDSKNRDIASTPDWAAYPASGEANTPTFSHSGELHITGTSSTVAQGALLDDSKLTTPVVGRTYRISAEIWWDSSDPGVGSVFKIKYAGATSSAFAVTGSGSDSTTDAAVYTVDLVAENTTGDLLIYYESANTTEWYIDDITVKEVGIATGWTDADQQLHIPQTALQSYNEFAWMDGFNNGVNSGDIDCGSDASMDNIWVGGGTFSAWIYANDIGAAGHGRIADKHEWKIFLSSKGSSSCDVRFTHVHSTTMDVHSVDTVINFGQWQHVVVTYDNGNPGAGPVIYINGESISVTPVSSTGDGAPNSDVGDNLFIGNKEDGTRTFEGSITEVSLWTNTLTKTEVRELYNDGKALDATTHSSYVSTPANLKGYWRNNGLSTWTDLSDNSNNGTVNNITETMFCPSGVDSSRCSQGFLMNRQKNTSSLNFNTNKIVNAIGDGNRVVAGSIDLDTDDFSISFWAYKFRDWHEQFVISQTTDSNNYWYIRGNTNDPPTFQLAAVMGGTAILSDADSTSLDGADYIENWMHVTLTVDRSDTSNGIQWYINGAATSNGGVQSGETTTSLSLPENVVIGFTEHVSFDDNHFDGKIDGVFVYTNKLLSAAEVLQNYNATKSSHTN